MKIKIKKSNLIVPGIILLLVIVFSVFFFSERYNQVNGSFSLNKFQDIAENCEQTNSFGKISFKCSALLERYEEREENTECFFMALVDKDYKLQPITICEEKGIVEFDREEMITEQMVPVEVNFYYTRILFGEYNLQKFELSLLMDEEIFELLGKVYPNGAPQMNIRRNALEEVKKAGYYPANDLIIADGKTVKRVFFYLGEIMDAKIEESEMVFDLKLNINREEFLTTLSAQKLSYEKEMDRSTRELSLSNFKDYDMDGITQVMFFYLDEKSNVTNADILEYCSKEETDFDSIALCTIAETRNISEFKVKDIDKYIEDVRKSSEDGVVNFDKLIFAFLMLRP